MHISRGGFKVLRQVRTGGPLQTCKSATPDPAKVEREPSFSWEPLEDRRHSKPSFEGGHPDAFRQKAPCHFPFIRALKPMTRTQRQGVPSDGRQPPEDPVPGPARHAPLRPLRQWSVSFQLRSPCFSALERPAPRQRILLFSYPLSGKRPAEDPLQKRPEPVFPLPGPLPELTGFRLSGSL